MLTTLISLVCSATEGQPNAPVTVKNRRRNLRYRADLCVTLTSPKMFGLVTLIDVSHSGARCKVPGGAEVGSSVFLTFQGGPREFTTITAEVVRTRGEEVGLAFDSPLASGIMSRVLAAA